MLKIKGTVHEIGRTEEIGEKGFAKRTLVICRDPSAQYPEYAAFEAKRSQKKDRTLLLDGIRLGEDVEVTFTPDARVWTDPKTGRKRWFASLVLIDVCRVVAAQPEAAPRLAPPTQGTPGVNNAADDDLPY